jgi:hypothetical protein
LGLGGTVPTEALAYLARNGVKGRAFNSYDVGAHLIYELWPAIEVCMDSRNDVYGEALYREYRAALDGGPPLRAYLQKWSIDLVVATSKASLPPEFFYSLEQSGEWAPVYMDPLAVVFLRRTEAFKPLIARDEVRL